MSAPEARGAQPPRTISEVHRSRWPSWIWGVPLAAAGVVVWLLLRAFSDRGIEATVIFDEAAGMKVGDTHVLHRGLTVGSVRNLTLAPDGLHVTAQLNLDKSMEPYLRTGTRFYLRGAKPSLSDPASLRSILSGPDIILMAGSGAPERHFSGQLGEAPERLAVSLPYVLRFSEAVGQLKVGSPVSVLGFTVGEVADVQLMTDPAGARVSAAVLVMLDPTRFHIQRAAAEVHDWPALMNTTLEHLIRQGLRARLTQDPPLVGSQRITLDMVPEAGAGMLVTAGPYPEIPVKEGNGLQGLLAQAGALPLGEIGENVRSITAQLKTISSSPQLKDSIGRLDASLTELDRTVHQAGPQIEPTLRSVRQTVDSLQQTAGEIDATAAAARHTLAGGPAAANGNLQESLRELTDAARAIRTLANDIDQRPESLVRGR